MQQVDQAITLEEEMAAKQRAEKDMNAVLTDIRQGQYGNQAITSEEEMAAKQRAEKDMNAVLTDIRQGKTHLNQAIT